MLIDSSDVKRIPIADPAMDMAEDLDAFKSILERVLTSGLLVLGPEVSLLERELGELIAPGRRVVSCASGTDALTLAIRVLDLPEGTRVGIAPNAGFYATIAALHCNLLPLFMDVDLESGSSTLSSVQAAISEGARAIIVTHLYGLINPNVVAIAQLCKEQGVYLIEDCSQSFGAKLASGVAGSFGDLSTFSFYPSKNLGALGDGGAVSTASPKFESKLRSLRQYGWGKKYHVELAGGLNSRLDELQAGFLRHTLQSLESRNARRSEIAASYLESVQENSNLIPPTAGDTLGNVWHLFVVRTGASMVESLRDHLMHAGVEVGVHYPVTDNQLRPDLPSCQGGVPNAEERSRTMLSLPIFPSLGDEQVTRVKLALEGWNP